MPPTVKVIMITYLIIHLTGAFLGLVCARLYLLDQNNWKFWPKFWCTGLALMFGPMYLLTASQDLKERIRQGYYGKTPKPKPKPKPKLTPKPKTYPDGYGYWSI